MLPALGANGYLPVGRYRTDLATVEQEFVLAPAFSGSRSRVKVWEGFLRWLADWAQAEADAGVEVLHSLWLAGSFISSELNPSDLDISPVISQGALDERAGQRGIGKLKRLVGHRERLRAQYGVDVFPLPWVPVDRLFGQGVQSVDGHKYLLRRGALDDFWQRIGPENPGPLVQPSCHAERGLVEVIL